MAAVGVAHARPVVGLGLAVEAAQRLVHRCQVVGVAELGQRAADDLPGLPAEHLEGGRRHVHDGAVGHGHRDIARVLGEQPVAGLAVARPCLGVDQRLLLALERRDVGMHEAAAAVDGVATLFHNAHPAVVGQLQLVGRAGEALVLAQRLEAAAQRIRSRVGVPRAPVQILEALSGGSLDRRQAVEREERLVGPQRAVGRVDDEHSVGDALEQRARRVVERRRRTRRRRGRPGDVAELEPQAHPAERSHLERRHAQPLAAVLELERPALRAMALDAGGDVAFDQRAFVADQARSVVAPQVLGVRFAGVHPLGMLGEQLEEGTVPDQRSVIGVEGAKADRDAVAGGTHGAQQGHQHGDYDGLRRPRTAMRCIVLRRGADEKALRTQRAARQRSKRAACRRPVRGARGGGYLASTVVLT